MTGSETKTTSGHDMPPEIITLERLLSDAPKSEEGRDQLTKALIENSTAIVAQFRDMRTQLQEKTEEVDNMHTHLNKELRPQLAKMNFFYEALKETYLELKGVKPEDMPEKLIEFIQNLVSQREDYKTKAFTDPLTGLHNRAYFERSLEDAIHEVEEDGGRLTLAFVDIDHFKQANDYKEHDDESLEDRHTRGDVILKQLASMLEKSLPDKYEVCRVGGEEFGIIIPDEGIDAANSQEHTKGRYARHRLSTLRSKIENANFAKPDGTPYIHHNPEGYEIPLTISLGLVDYKRGDKISDMMKKADDALYAAKGDDDKDPYGRNRLVVYGEKPEAIYAEGRPIEPLKTRLRKAKKMANRILKDTRNFVKYVLSGR